MTRSAKLLASLMMMIAAATAEAALSSRYASFAEGPAKWWMTDQDRIAWQGVKDDADARRFIALFWARRDPTPGTPENEFRDEFDRRVAWADAMRSWKDTRGSLTDAGRVYVVLGPARIRMLVGAQKRDLLEGQTTSNSFISGPPSKPSWLAPGAFAQLYSAVQAAIVSPGLQSVPAWAPAEPEWSRFRITLVRASAARFDETWRDQKLPPGVQEAVDDVRTLLPYRTYQFVDAVTFDARANEPVTQLTLSPNPEKAYSIVFRYGDAGTKLEVTQDKGAAVVATAFSIKPGETVSIGASNSRDAKQAVMFFVTWVTTE